VRMIYETMLHTFTHTYTVLSTRANVIPCVWISNITALNALYVVNILNIKTRVKTLIVTKLCLKYLNQSCKILILTLKIHVCLKLIL